MHKKLLRGFFVVSSVIPHFRNIPLFSDGTNLKYMFVSCCKGKKIQVGRSDFFLQVWRIIPKFRNIYPCIKPAAVVLAGVDPWCHCRKVN